MRYERTKDVSARNNRSPSTEVRRLVGIDVECRFVITMYIINGENVIKQGKSIHSIALHVLDKDTGPVDPRIITIIRTTYT